MISKAIQTLKKNKPQQVKINEKVVKPSIHTNLTKLYKTIQNLQTNQKETSRKGYTKAIQNHNKNKQKHQTT